MLLIHVAGRCVLDLRSTLERDTAIFKQFSVLPGQRDLTSWVVAVFVLLALHVLAHLRNLLLRVRLELFLIKGRNLDLAFFSLLTGNLIR